MNRNDLGIFIENINFELDKIRNNEAYINNKSYFGLDKELLSYIRKLEQALDENNKLKIQISAREEEYKKLEDNWNELKEYLHNVDVVIDYSENYDGKFINYDELIDKMQELEQGSDSNGNN